MFELWYTLAFLATVLLVALLLYPLSRGASAFFACWAAVAWPMFYYLPLLALVVHATLAIIATIVEACGRRRRRYEGGDTASRSR